MRWKGLAVKTRGTKAEARKKKETPETLPLFTIIIHNFAFSLAAHGSEKRKTTARSLLHSATLGYLTRHAQIMNKMFFFVPGIVMCFLVI